MPKKIEVRVLRQHAKGAPQRWDTFTVPYMENMNVISCLMEIRKKPVTIEGKSVEPPAWEAACLEEVCGSCTMNINGRIRQACTALVDEVGQIEGETVHVTLEPMKKFPLIRDLIVDRGRMFQALIKVKGWVPIDGSYDMGPAAQQDDHVRKLRYKLSQCMTCGCCLEACPQVNEKTAFVGPQAIGQALLFNSHPIGQVLETDRLDYLTTEEGLTNCGNAQNCVKVCPKGVPLTQAIAELNRASTVYKIKRFFGISA